VGLLKANLGRLNIELHNPPLSRSSTEPLLLPEKNKQRHLWRVNAPEENEKDAGCWMLGRRCAEEGYALFQASSIQHLFPIAHGKKLERKEELR
jgi:hypothetical protein